MADDNNNDPQGQSQENANNDNSQSTVNENSEEKGREAANLSSSANEEEVPEKFKGKSAAEIAKAYTELEKTLGKHSTASESAKKELAQWKTLGNIIESNPQLYQQVEAELLKLRGKSGDTIANDPQSNQRDDGRLATQNIVIGKFEEQYGIDRLPESKRKELHAKIGNELAEILDPGGDTPLSDLVNKVPLDRLGKYLEKAYKLVASTDDAEKVRMQTLIDARQNSDAAFGYMPSNGARTNNKTLSAEEQKVAKRMGMKEEEYIKYRDVEEN